MGKLIAWLQALLRNAVKDLADVLRWLQRVLRRWLKWFGLLLTLVVIWAVIGIIDRTWSFWDDDPLRGAVKTVASDKFGDHFNDVTYLSQGWTPADSLWFYNTSEGSDLLPYDFFLELEQKESQALFRDPENMNHYGYLPQRETFSNPDGLPVGMTRDTYRGKSYMGFTCAACHTSQINYKGMGIRIDGGPAGSDMETFMVDLADAMYATYGDENKFDRFAKRVMARGHYDDKALLKEDLEKYARRIKTYTVINNPRNYQRPLTVYGYGRLDAFGRIFNRILEYVIRGDEIDAILKETLPEQKYREVMAEIKPILYGEQRDHLIQRIERTLQQKLTIKQLLTFRNRIFNPADAPVSYPFLWDIPQHDYVQWNGVVANAGAGPLGRNAGQVIGVFGTLDWQQQPGVTLSSILGGQGLKGPHISFQSSINLRNMRMVESQLRKLESPRWPENILGAIDRDKAARGEVLFDRYCQGCHQEINRSDPKRRVIAQMTRVDHVGTDAKMATNAISDQGYSGILEKQYVDTGVGNVLLQKRFPVAPLLTSATKNALLTPDPDKSFIRRYAERIFDFFVTIFDNEVKASIKRGDYQPDTTVNPFASLMAYKGRSLNGIWATAPYLHNGSVPTLYNLLLPKEGSPSQCGEVANDGQYRPNDFMVGSREFDPKQVGFKYAGYDGFKYQTHIYGNGNGGHEYAAGKTRQMDGSCPPPLNEQQRWDLVEYLKTL